jgi:protein-L-isoaspartate(D-aspartate) O-methyltransferase
VLVTAAAPRVPRTLTDQLGPGGRLVIPLGDLANQELVVLRRTNAGLEQRRAGGVRFVPLVSREGFPDPLWP